MACSVMDSTRRRELAEKLLDGYVSGPTATTEATARARQKADVAQAVVIVEGSAIRSPSRSWPSDSAETWMTKEW